MCAARVKMVARNARAIPDDDCERGGPGPNYYELKLSDEHMTHVARFRGLGPFDRAQWERMRGYRAFKLREITAQRDRATVASATEVL
jgi:hypothetical protein